MHLFLFSLASTAADLSLWCSWGKIWKVGTILGQPRAKITPREVLGWGLESVGSREMEEEWEHLHSLPSPSLTFPFPSFPLWAGEREDGWSQPEECRGLPGTSVLHKKVIRTSGTSLRDKCSLLGAWSSPLQDSDQSKEKYEREITSWKDQKNFLPGKKNKVFLVWERERSESGERENPLN